MNLRLTFILMLLTASPKQGFAVDWEFVGGNEGGAVVALTVDQQNSDVVYAGIGKQIYKTVDGADSWALLIDELGDDANVQDIAIDPVNSSNVYAGTVQGLYKSDDGGSNWTHPLGGVSVVWSIAIDPMEPDNVYAATGLGVYKSDDAGVTWNVIDTGLSGGLFDSLRIDPSDPQILYVSNSVGVIFRTADSGENWSAVAGTGLNSNRRIDVLVLDPVTPSTIYTIASRADVYKSTDSGANWVDLNFTANSLVIDPITTSTLYACKQEALFRSIDGGQTWTEHSEVFSSVGIPFAVSTGCFHLRVSSNPLIMYAGGGGGIIKSVDAGSNWNKKNGGINAAGIFEIVVDPVTPTTLYSLSTSGGYHSSDAGASWIRIQGIDRNRFHQLVIDPVTPTILYAIQNSVMYKSVDGGAVWNNIGLPGSPRIIAIDPATPTTLYSHLGGGIYKSTDSASSWTQMNNGLTDLGIVSLIVNPHTPTTVYVGTNNDGFFRSLDGGANWTAINTGITVEPGGIFSRRLVVDPFDATTLYASSNNGLYVSANNGDNWSAIDYSDINPGNKFFDNIFAAPGPDSQTILYVHVPSADDGIWKSINGGMNWTPFADGFDGSMFSSSDNNLFASSESPGMPIYAGTDIGTYVSIPDFDGDGVPDVDDAFPNDPTEWVDTDGDGVGDNSDAFPSDPGESADTDGDGIGNNADTDDDGDSMPDDYEIANGLDPLNAADAAADADGDGFTNLEEFLAGTDPQNPDDFPANKVPVSIFILLDDEG